MNITYKVVREVSVPISVGKYVQQSFSCTVIFWLFLLNVREHNWNCCVPAMFDY